MYWLKCTLQRQGHHFNIFLSIFGRCLKYQESKVAINIIAKFICSQRTQFKNEKRVIPQI